MPLSVDHLRAHAQHCESRRRHMEALAAYRVLEQLAPEAGEWPHRKARLMASLGYRTAAIQAYQRAAARYEVQGQLGSSIAVHRSILALEPDSSASRQRIAALVARSGDVPAEDERPTLRLRAPQATPLPFAPTVPVRPSTPPGVPMSRRPKPSRRIARGTGASAAIGANTAREIQDLVRAYVSDD